MNRAQKVILWFGILGFALAGLFPSWEQDRPGGVASLGRASLFVGPQKAVTDCAAVFDTLGRYRPTFAQWDSGRRGALTADELLPPRDAQERAEAAYRRSEQGRREQYTREWDTYDCATAEYLVEDRLKRPVAKRSAPVTPATIDATRLLIEWTLMVVLVAGLVLTLGGKKSSIDADTQEPHGPAREPGQH